MDDAVTVAALTSDQASLALLGMIQSPLADGFIVNVTRDDDDPRSRRVDWDAVYDQYPRLSSGERSLVDLACHVTGRLVHNGGDRPSTLFACFGAVDSRTRKLAATAVQQWLLGVAR